MATDGAALLSELTRLRSESLPVLQAEVAEWALVTFPGSMLAAKLAHLRDEIDEIEADPSDPMEFADVLLILLHAAAGEGHDLLAATRTKFEIVKQRKMGDSDARGVVRRLGAGETIREELTRLREAEQINGIEIAGLKKTREMFSEEIDRLRASEKALTERAEKAEARSAENHDLWLAAARDREAAHQAHAAAESARQRAEAQLEALTSECEECGGTGDIKSVRDLYLEDGSCQGCNGLGRIPNRAHT